MSPSPADLSPQETPTPASVVCQQRHDPQHLVVLLPKWARLLSRAVKLLGMLGAVIAGYLLVSNWNEISATLHL